MSELETPKAQDLTNLEQLIAQFQNGIILARLEEYDDKTKFPKLLRHVSDLEVFSKAYPDAISLTTEAE